MRLFRTLFLFLAVTLTGAFALPGNKAQAACRWFKATHNGTDFFYADGAAGTAEFKVKSMIESWTASKGIRRKKIYMTKTKCGDWFVKYMLPHKHCVAKAKVCF